MNRVFHFKERTVLMLEGTDCAHLLQGLVTNDITHCREGAYVYCFMLTPQGRFLYDFFITIRNEKWLIDCQVTRLQEIIKKLKMYKLRLNVDITDASSTLRVYHSSHPLNEYSIPDPRCADLGYRTIDNLIVEDTPGAEKEYHIKRITALVADADKDLIYEKSLPLDFEGDRLNAISFIKGCYIGQEVTARMNWRGNRRKKLYLLEILEGSLQDQTIELGGHKIGIALSREGGYMLGLLEETEAERIQQEHAGIILLANAKLCIKRRKG